MGRDRASECAPIALAEAVLKPHIPSRARIEARCK